MSLSVILTSRSVHGVQASPPPILHSTLLTTMVQNTSADRSAAFALVLASIVGLTAMAFHPSGQDVLRSAVGGTSSISTSTVHSLALAAPFLVLAGTLALRLRVKRDLSIAAYIVYAVASVAEIIVGVASGFLVPSVPGGYVEADKATRPRC